MPLSFKEENMHLISPSFLMGLMQWLLKVKEDTLTLADFEAGPLQKARTTGEF